MRLLSVMLREPTGGRAASFPPVGGWNMSIKVKLLTGLLVAVATVAAVKLVPTHSTHAPYATAFRVTASNANALAPCPERRCVYDALQQARCITAQGGCNLKWQNNHFVCGPVQICLPDPEIALE